jgi:iron complex outermembrane recepter protein
MNPLNLLLTSALIATSQYGFAKELAIDTVIVTAQRQESPNPALSVSSIEGIQDIHATHISEILTQSPGTWISRGNGQEHLTAIRSPVLTGSGGCGPFLMAEDNISLRAPAFCNVNQLFDANFEQADRIEVLRGPGTAFHGSSAMHGIINIISPDFSAQPVTKVSEEIETSHQYGRLLVDHRAENWLLQTHAAKDNGYKEDSGFDQQKVRFKYRQMGASWSLVHNLNLTNLKQDTAGFVVGKDAYKDDSRKDENTDPDAYRDAQSLRYSASLNYTLTEQSHFLFTPYVRANEMDFLMHFQPGTPTEENGHHSLGFQSAYFHQLLAELKLVTGFDMDYTRGYLTQFQEGAGPSLNFPVGAHYDYDVNVLTSAIFLQSEYTFNEKGLITAGARFEDAQYDYTNNLSDGAACLPAATNCRYMRPADDALSFFNWSPKLSVSYEIIDNSTLYTTLAKAYRAPESSELFRLEQGQAIANIDSEEIQSLELGIKGQLFERVNYQFSAYHMDKDNVIFKDSNRQNVDNQKTSHDGLEASITAMLADSLILAAQLSYAKHQYDSNIQLIDGSTSFIKGNIIDTAPRQVHNVTLSWLPIENAQIDLEGVYIGKYYLDPDNQFTYPGHVLTNLRMKHTLAKEWEVAVGVLNLADEDYADRADLTARTFSNPIPQERYFIGEPRSYRVSVTKTF